MASSRDLGGVAALSTSTFLTTTPQDIQLELQLFLQCATGQRKVTIDQLAQSALFLLQRVPIARHAVLEYFCSVFDEAAGTYISLVDSGCKQEDVEDKMQEQASVLKEVTRVLLGFITTNPDAWAPIVSSWSLRLLGQVSSKYAGQHAMTMSSSINDLLQLWMTCPPTKLLMDLTVECFAAMVGGAPDSCVDALLEASVQYSPHFDWVVARIGSCFPTTIITRVLNCGLKDFCTVGAEALDREPGAGKKIPKMASVVGILGHLANKHQHIIRKALLGLFEEGLKASGDALRMTTVPFLLQLASMSPTLLQVLSSRLIKQLTPSVLNRLHHQFAPWTMSNPAEYNSFLNLVVHLLTKCDVVAFEIVDFIVSTAATPKLGEVTGEKVLEAVQDTCVELIHMLLFELQRGVHGKRREGLSDLPLLEGLAREAHRLVPFLLQSAQSDRLPWLEKLTVFTAVRAGENFAATILADIVTKATSPAQLALYFHLSEAVDKFMKGIAMTTVECLFGNMATLPPAQIIQLLSNLNRILLGEKRRARALGASVRFLGQAVQENLSKLCEVIHQPLVELSSCALQVLATVDVPITTTVLYRLASAVITVFFRLLWGRVEKGDDSHETNLVGIRQCRTCFGQLGRQPFVQGFILHHLLVCAVSHNNAALFGGVGLPLNSGVSGGVFRQGNLLQENRKMGLVMPLPRTHASVFHAGIIGQGLKRKQEFTVVSKDWVLRNQETLLEAVWACCQASVLTTLDTPASPDEEQLPPLSSALKSPKLSETAGRTLGCTLVDLLTADSLYNDIVWCDYDHLKFTLERDIHVWKVMESHPVLWSLLRALSGTGSCAFAYYCSPVYKSLTAMLVNKFDTARVQHMSELPSFCEQASWLVSAMAECKILPSPLSKCGELFPLMTLYEGQKLLLSIWRYVRENPPVNNKELMEGRKCDPRHTQVLRGLLNSNIDSMGHLYPRIFNT